MNEEDVKEIRAVRAALEGIRKTLEAIIRRTASAEKSILRSKRALRLSFVLLALDLVLSGAVVWVLHEQERTRSEVLCPLFAVFVGSYDPGSRTAGPDRDKYEDAFRVIRRAYDTLDCHGLVVPPRKDGAP